MTWGFHDIVALLSLKLKAFKIVCKFSLCRKRFPPYVSEVIWKLVIPCRNDFVFLSVFLPWDRLATCPGSALRLAWCKSIHALTTVSRQINWCMDGWLTPWAIIHNPWNYGELRPRHFKGWHNSSADENTKPPLNVTSNRDSNVACISNWWGEQPLQPMCH